MGGSWGGGAGAVLVPVRAGSSVPSDPLRERGAGPSAVTDLDELNDEGVGGTVGSKDTFEPEESDASRHAGGDSPQA